MNDKERIERLENVLTQFLQPVKNIPFEIVIRSMTGCRVLDFDPADPDDAELLLALKDCAKRVAEAVRLNPIRRPRPNEVGNDLEPFVMNAAMQAGLHCTKPLSKAGRGQGVGYPDLLVTHAGDRRAYLEVKSYAEGSALTTMRSFYLSPSEDPKVSLDAKHLLIGFGMRAEPLPGSRNSEYTVASYKIVNLHSLDCDVKYEFNSDNRRLYSKQLIVAEGVFQ